MNVDAERCVFLSSCVISTVSMSHRSFNSCGVASTLAMSVVLWVGSSQCVPLIKSCKQKIKLNNCLILEKLFPPTVHSRCYVSFTVCHVP